MQKDHYNIKVRGGSLNRYHTHVRTLQRGRGVTDDLVKIAGPMVIRELSKGVTEVQKGVPTTRALGRSMDRFPRDLKRKALAMVMNMTKGTVK